MIVLLVDYGMFRNQSYFVFSKCKHRGWCKTLDYQDKPTCFRDEITFSEEIILLNACLFLCV